MSEAEYKMNEQAREAFIQGFSDSFSLSREIKLVRAQIAELEKDGPTLTLAKFVDLLASLTKQAEASALRLNRLYTVETVGRFVRTLSDILCDVLESEFDEATVGRLADDFLARSRVALSALGNQTAGESNRLLGQ